jgi:catechol 2,3-dioxygenase-like lactoylglutathione lyase family enzyme
MQLTGIHHLTAVSADAPGNLAFYTKVMGMRLIKKTVNQDDVSAYHLSAITPSRARVCALRVTIPCNGGAAAS